MRWRCWLLGHDLPYVEWLHTGQKVVECQRCGRWERNPN